MVVDLVAGDLDDGLLAAGPLGAPHLIDSEVLQALRRLVANGELDIADAAIALDAFADLEIERFPADWLRPRMWELRHNLTGYDATYVALTEQLGATSLLTTDARLARAPGVRCTIELL